MSLDIQVVHSVEEIGQEAWDHLGGGRPFASYRWYRYGETVLADNTPIYIILSRQGEPVARGTFWLRAQEPLPISSRVVRRFAEALMHHWPLLVCKAPLADAPGLILPDPPLREAALEAIAQVAQDQAQRHRVSFAVYDYLTGHEARYAGWPSSFVAIEVPEPGTRLVITWPDFESYLRQVSRSVRRNYKRAIDLGIKIKQHPMTRPLDEATLNEAMVLIRSVENQHNSAPHPWARAMLKHAGMVDATWLKAEIEGRTVCCCILLRDEDTLMMKLLGRDYNVQYAYFLLFCSGIRYAIERGVQVVWGGSCTYDSKQRMGFQLEDNNHIVSAGNGPLLQRLGRWLATMMMR